MNWYKIALEVVEQGEDSYYTDVGHDWHFGYEDDFEEGRYNYMWALVNGVIDVEMETEYVSGHIDVERWETDIRYAGRYASGTKVISITRPQEGISQFRQIPQAVQDLLKQKFPEAEQLYVY